MLGVVSLGNFLVAQVLGFASALVAYRFGAGLWIALGVGVAVALVPLIRVAKHSLLDWVGIGWRYLTGRRYSIGSTVDFRSPSGRSVGLYWEGTRVVSVIEILPPRGGLTKISTEAFDATHRLPIAELAECLTQHDILLSGIDIISHGFRSRAGTPASTVYEQLIGPLPATATRTVWLAIMLDTDRSPEAVQRRGGGTEGASRAVTVATQRIVRQLGDAGCRARILTAPEIREAVLQVTEGTDPRTVKQTWKHALLGEHVNIGSALDPAKLSSELLAKVWAPSSRSTTVAVRLRPGSTPDTVAVGAAWRLTPRSNPEPFALKNRVSMRGKHRDGLLAHLPVGVAGTERTIPTREFTLDAVDGLQLPSSGCGQLVGSDEQGQAIAARIVGTGIASVYIAAEIYVAQQVIFRALAIGARALVRTDRPHAWEMMVSTIASPDRLHVAGETNISDAGYNVIVIDGVEAPDPHAGITTIYLTGDPDDWPVARPDVWIHQPGAYGRRITLSTGSNEVDLDLVTIPRETAFIGRARGTQALASA